jgi:hypothetical protein
MKALIRKKERENNINEKKKRRRNKISVYFTIFRIC